MLPKKYFLNLDDNTPKTYLVTDIETTGQKPEDAEIIEIASVKVENGKITDKFSSLVKPSRSIPEFITKITGITDDDVEDAPPIEPVLKEWCEFAKGADYFCAHNVMFDHDFIYKYLKLFKFPLEDFNKMTFFCTVKAARLLYPDLKSRKLADLIQHFKIEVENRHRALDDALATAQILVIFFEEMRKRKDDLLSKIEEMQDDKIKSFEVAEYLSVPREKVYQLVRNKELKVVETYTTRNGYEGYLFLRRDIENMVTL